MESLGFYEDELTRVQYNEIELDPGARCQPCLSCNCITKAFPVGESVMTVRTTSEVAALKDKTAAEIIADVQLQKKFNPGRLVWLCVCICWSCIRLFRCDYACL